MFKSVATDTCVFASVAQTTKIPIRTFEYPGVVNSKLAWTLSFYLHGGNQSFKFFKYCKREIHDARFCSLEFTGVDSLPTGGLWFPQVVYSCSWLNVDHVAGTVLSTFRSYLIRSTVVLEVAIVISPFYPWETWSESKVSQSCPILCYSKDCGPPGSSVHEFSRQEYWSG